MAEFLWKLQLALDDIPEHDLPVLIIKGYLMGQQLIYNCSEHVPIQWPIVSCLLDHLRRQVRVCPAEGLGVGGQVGFGKPEIG